MRRFPQLLQDFGSDRRGSFAIAGALAVPVLALAVGYAVDVAQLLHTRSSLQNALDAAVTSTARDLTTGKIKEKDARKNVEAFLQANASVALAENDTVALGRLVVNRIAKTVEADATVQADMLFPLFGAAAQRQVGVNAAALYSDKKVAMMLDITGSMAGKKIKDLKTAAGNAVDALLGGVDPDNPRVRVSIVPYAEAVNAGKLAATAVLREVQDKEAPTSLLVKGSTVDILPQASLVSAGGKIVKAEPNLPPPAGATTALTAALTAKKVDNCATERKLPDGAADVSDAAPGAARIVAGLTYPALVNRDDRLSASACPTPSLVPLTADADALNASIEKFSANGYTAGAIALQWGYYMLSPEWRGTIKDAGLGDGAAAYENKKTAKVAILMTDGEFNTAFTGGSPTDTNVHDKGATSGANAQGICDAMKESGIQVFTVGFALPAKESSAARKVLKACASPDTGAIKHFYDVANGEELDEAFQEIIANAERLAVTK